MSMKPDSPHLPLPSVIFISPGRLSGTITAPPSKSMMQRVMAAALLCEGHTFVSNAGSSKDDEVAMDIIKQLGAVVKKTNKDPLIITGKDQQDQEADIHLYCGESGLASRLFIPIAAMRKGETTITGAGSLMDRPFDEYDRILPQLGVAINSREGRLPIEVKGPVKPVNLDISGAVSSQYLSGILFAYGALEAKDCTIRVENPTSTPYIDLTLSILKHFGFKTPANQNYRIYTYDNLPSGHSPENVNITIEGDWSGAAFFLIAGALRGPVSIRGLNKQSDQGDMAILKILENCGAVIHWEGHTATVSAGEKKPFYFDATDCPDLFPPLAVLAAFCKGESTIRGIHRLIHKESNRITSIVNMCTALGIPVKTENDSLIITGDDSVRGGIVDSANDHRIAMAAAIIGANSQEGIKIKGFNAAEKSYPTFLDHLSACNGSFSILDVKDPD